MNKFEKLANYKQLLDQGAITQEEYDEAKNKLLKGGISHEYLESGARVVLDAVEKIKNKTDETYTGLKEKSNQWVEKELEKDRKIENEKKIKKEKREQEREIARSRRKQQTEKNLTNIKSILKHTLLCILIAIIVLAVAAAVFFFSREKISFSDLKTESVHGLQYSISEKYKSKQSVTRTDNDKEITPETAEYEISDSSNNLIAKYSIEYLGEDIDTEHLKERMCRSMYKAETSKIDNGFKIEGYYKSNKLTPRNIIGNGIMNWHVMICTYDYSSFMISLKCNAWNFDPKVCEQLFNSVKLKQYTNINKAESLNTIYSGSYRAGYKPVKDDFRIEVNYKNGKRSTAEVFDAQIPKVLSEKENSVVIECHGLKSVFKIRPSDDKEVDVNVDKNEQSDKSVVDDDWVNGDGGQQT